MTDDTVGELDGKPVRLGDVPRERRAEWVAVIDGERIRPFRFVGESDDAIIR